MKRTILQTAQKKLKVMKIGQILQPGHRIVQRIEKQRINYIKYHVYINPADTCSRVVSFL